MKLSPFQRFTIDTPLSLPEASVRLRAGVEPRRWFRMFDDHKPFQGEVKGESFAIERVINYRNSFLPRVRGRIVATPAGARLEGTMRPHAFVLVFMIAWLSIAAVASFALVPLAWKGPRFDAGALIPLGMFAFGVVLSLGGFHLEARKARRLLAEVVQGAEAS